MRAGCSASTFVLVAAWEQSLHPGSPGNRLEYRKGPLNADNAVRTTGLLTAGRNPGDRTDPVRQPLATEGKNVTSEGQIPTARQRTLWENVQQAKLEGLSFRATARELGIHRNTVRKYTLAESPPLRKIKSAATTLQPETRTPD